MARTPEWNGRESRGGPRVRSGDQEISPDRTNCNHRRDSLWPQKGFDERGQIGSAGPGERLTLRLMIGTLIFALRKSTFQSGSYANPPPLWKARK
jgi:hypothetical protein